MKFEIDEKGKPVSVYFKESKDANKLIEEFMLLANRRQCKVCGKYFLAKSQRYELCSDKCRKVQALQNKREFDERARENNYDLLYKNECQNWRNKINRVKNTAGFPADRLEKIQVAFSDFKKEALQRKKAVKTGTASPKEFTDWLYLQSNVIVRLTEY